MSDRAEQVQKLKDDGNDFYKRKKYSAAIKKYTEAIQIDDTVALLFANRAACRLALKQYLDALADAVKATELDPNYSKAWARRAAVHDALGQNQGSRVMWEKALEALPKGELSETDKNLKKQYEEGLAKAKAEINKLSSSGPRLSGSAIQIQSGNNDLPWDVAAQIVVELEKKQDPKSSAWVIYMADKEFQEAVSNINEYKTQVIGGRTLAKARMGGLANLTNAILRDTRVFRISQPDLLVKLMESINIERQCNKGWFGEMGPETVQREALERLRTEERASVRRALSSTIRDWIIVGFLRTKINPNFAGAMEYLQRALDMINWGRDQWPNMHKEQRGAVFTRTFRRGVWNLLLNAMMEAYASNPGKRSLLNKINVHADGLLEDLENDRPEPGEEAVLDAGFRWSFWENIKGNAFACKGFYHVQLAKLSDTDPNADLREVGENLFAAFQCYFKAAQGFPEDDYYHPWFLWCAIENMLAGEPPTDIVLKLLEEIRLCVPKVRSLWYRNPAQTNEPQLKHYEYLDVVEKGARKLIERGEVGINDPFDMARFHKAGEEVRLGEDDEIPALEQLQLQ
ncbi:hypothetical protein D9758_008407 [Tetrapyrgos nigripes]|uniref:TPR-like protein n=1 Tax=Tetrapyrgos nigripes TaxID=182062 RepID=A0A8H5LN54_9AGAR|nr:hypothetical protein D9758_008407 [Tetrapyrgos nigripes]